MPGCTGAKWTKCLILYFLLWRWASEEYLRSFFTLTLLFQFNKRFGVEERFHLEILYRGNCVAEFIGVAFYFIVPPISFWINEILLQVWMYDVFWYNFFTIFFARISFSEGLVQLAAVSQGQHKSDEGQLNAPLLLQGEKTIRKTSSESTLLKLMNKMVKTKWEILFGQFISWHAERIFQLEESPHYTIPTILWIKMNGTWKLNVRFFLFQKGKEWHEGILFGMYNEINIFRR